MAGFTRRSWLKFLTFGLVGAPAVVQSDEAPTSKRPPVADVFGRDFAASIERAADEVEEFARRGALPDWPPTISLPFSAGPANVYARPAVSVDLPALQAVVDMTRRGAMYSAFLLAQTLWTRHRPAEFPELTLPPPRGWNKSLSRIEARPERLVTPKFVVDTAELTSAGLAGMMTGVLDLAREMSHLYRTAVETARATYPGRPLEAYSWVGLPTIVARLDGWMFEFFAGVVVAGVVYSEAVLDQMPPGAERDATVAMIAEYRRSAPYWQSLE